MSGSVAAVLLAAGGSSRLGTPKPLAEIGGLTLVERAADEALAAGCSPVVAVVGDEADSIAGRLVDRAVEVVVNDAWGEGLGSSIRCGTESALRAAPGIAAVLLMTVDQPLVTAAHLGRLVAAWREDRPAAVASAYGGVLGVPALFDRERFADLTALRGDRGARDLLRREGATVTVVACPEAALDVDTPEDLDRIGRMLVHGREDPDER